MDPERMIRVERSAEQDRYYRIGTVVLRSAVELKSFGAFACDPADADVTVERAEEFPPEGKGINTGSVIIRSSGEGWIFQPARGSGICLYVSHDYTKLRLVSPDHPCKAMMSEMLVRMALECLLACRGYVSVHSACIAVDGKAIAFCGPSGIGKSTRAGAWIEAFGAELISGDRPLVHVKKREVFGVPWDGKEKCYRNVSYPLQGIYEVRRSGCTYVREMSFEQRRRLLLRQCFIPMWDTETAAIQMMNISRLASGAEMFRVFGGPTANDARELRELLDQQRYLKEEKDMKVKEGFVLRNIADEYILMPVGDNIRNFNGTLLMNEVSAFIWEKLQTPMSGSDLLTAILEEFDVDEETAAVRLRHFVDNECLFALIAQHHGSCRACHGGEDGVEEEGVCRKRQIARLVYRSVLATCHDQPDAHQPYVG